MIATAYRPRPAPAGVGDNHVRLIESGITADPRRLSRRCRFAAVAYDIHADIAATWFVRRGHPVPQHEIHVLGLEKGRWQVRFGGKFGDGDDRLSDRPGLDVLGAPLVIQACGGLIPPNVPHAGPAPDQLGYVALRAASTVGSVALDRGDTLAVPRHGNLLVVWRRQAPVANALDADGAHLVSVNLGEGRPDRDSSAWSLDTRDRRAAAEPGAPPPRPCIARAAVRQNRQNR